MTQFPFIFWIVVLIEGIMVFGYSIAFPFLAIYLNIKGYDETYIGFYFSVVMFISSFGNSFGGSWSDYIGRKKVLFLSLFLRGIFILAISLVIRFNMNVGFILLFNFLSSLSSLGFHSVVIAYISDFISEKDRVKAFSILRIFTNLGWALGPAVGGFLTGVSYSFTFFISSIIFLLTSIYVCYFFYDVKTNLNEIKFSLRFNYKISKEFGYLLFYSFIMTAVMSHLVVPLSLYSKRYLGFSEKEIGFLFSVNGFFVILIQYFIGKIISKNNIVKFLFVSCLLYGVGYLMFGYSPNYAFALVSIVVVTLGEVIFSPSITAYASYVVPSSKKGGYLGLHGMVSEFGRSFGIFIGSFFIDNFSPHFKQFPWFFVFFLSLISGFGFLSIVKLEKESKKIL